MTQPGLAPLNGTADLDTTRFVRGARDALKAVREVADYVKRNGTLTLTAKLAGATPAAIRAAIAAAAGTSPLSVKLTFDQASISTALAALRTQLNAVAGLNVSTLTAAQAQTNTLIAQLTALIAQLRALGGGAGGAGGAGAGGRSGFSVNTQTLLSDLEKLNNEYKRGDINVNAYALRLTALQTSLRVAAAGATAGSAEFKALDQALTRTTQGLRNVNSAGITQLRTELSGARAAFDAAAAAATNLAQRRAAVAAYETEINRIRVALQGMASSGQLTAAQLGQVNRALAQTTREANTIRGGVNIAGLSGNIGNALQQLTSFLPGVGQLTSMFGALPGPILATAAAVGVFVAAMGASFRTAAQFQQGMADIKALTQPTAEGLQDLKDAALTLGTDLGVGPRAAAAGILELNRAGLSAKDVIGGGLTGALNLAGAAGIQVAEAAKLSAAAMTAFKLSSQDLPRVADNFANFSNSTFLGAEDLAQAIAAVGPVAVNAGLNIEQFGGIMATAAQGGFKAMSDAGTSVKTMLLSLQSPSEVGAKALAKIGVNAYDAEGNFRPFLDTVDDLRVALAGMSEQGRNRILKDVFGSDAIRVATILLNSNSEAIDKNIATQGKQGEAARIAAERLETYQGEVGRLQTKLEQLRIVVGDKLLPVATAVIKAFSSGVDNLIGFANGTENLMGYVLPLVGAFVAFKGAVIAAAAPALWATLMAAVTTFFGTVTTFATANPFGLIATAVAALAVTVNKLMSDTARIYDEIDQQQQESFDNTMKRVQALTAEGTELSRTQAKLLLAMDTLQSAETGRVTGVNIWGERTYEVDPKEVEVARARVQELRTELTALRTENQRRSITTEQATGVDPERVKQQSAAVEDLRKTLSERSFQLKIGGLEGIEKEVAQVEKTFDDLRKKLKESFGGNLNSNELKGALAELAATQEKEVSAVRARYAAERAAERQKEYQQAAASARQAAFGVQRAELDAMREGQAKRQAERDLDLAELQDEIARQVAEYAKYPDLKAQVESDGRRQVVALRRRWQEEDRVQAEENAKAIAEAEGEARAAVIAAMPEGAARLAAERAEELASVQQSIRDRLTALAGYPAEQARIEGLGQQRIAALRQGWARDDEKDAQERAGRIVKAFEAAQNAQFAAQQAGRDRQQAQADLDTARRVAQAGRDALKVAEIEGQAAGERADAVQETARLAYRQERKLLERAANEKLRTEGLTAREVADIRRQFYSDVDALDAKFSSDSLKRLQEREQEERDTAEKIRQARVAAAFRPSEDASRLVQDVEREGRLAQTTADRLVAQQGLTAAQLAYAGSLALALDSGEALLLTDEERRQKADSLKDAQLSVVESQRQEVELARQLVEEARGVETAYARVARLLATPGAGDAQRDLAEATGDVADAYSRALPYLQQFRSGSLKPGDFTPAKDALEDLVSALEAQRQKLEALRGEYDRQRTALQSVQDVLRGFGQEFGDAGLLDNAVQFNQGTYNAAKQALDGLLKGGQYDAAQLAEATQKLQSTYGGLKDSVEAVGEAQARVHEKEVRRIQTESEARTKALDRQIKAAQAAGNDAEVKNLEAQRDRIVLETEGKVSVLEAQAEAARKQAAAALTERTQGLQQVLQGVAQGAQKAQAGVQQLGSDVQKAEADMKASASRMKDALGGVFSQMPGLAAAAGRDAGRAFVQQLQAQLSGVRLPAVAAPRAVAVPGGGSGTGGTTVFNLYYNGQRQPTSQDLQQLARDLTPLIRAEAQRRSPAGPCRT
ncbi:phage tail tape measure protein [Deinococcus sp. HMF7620]|uniref:Phage tail tape measure protein n=1 Tax=Deinococcus arboris TaxID=2682977 RepID=A0A7C9HRJ7_9DEIO|nr:phage tail tape measure protein [Deinococcus arboris]MVN86912.1 phage tail tape measure protein [Deinococcus arboris]